MKWKQVGIAALQEAMWSKDTTVQGRDGEVVINFGSTDVGYRGLGFYLSSKWAQRLMSTRVINGRMVVARFNAFNDEKANLVIVNV